MKLFGNRRIEGSSNGLRWWHETESERDEMGDSNRWRYHQDENGIIVTKVHYEPHVYMSSEDFRPLDREHHIGDYYRSFDGILYQLEEIVESTYTFRKLHSDSRLRITTINLFEFIATSDYEEFEVVKLNTPEIGDIVLVNNSGSQYNGKYVEVCNVNSAICTVSPLHDMRPYQKVGIPKSKLIVAVKRPMPEMKAFSQTLETIDTPRVKCSLRNTTHVIPNDIRRQNPYSVDGLKLSVNGYPSAYDFKRYQHDGWLIDLIVQDMTAARGSVIKTFYRAFDPIAATTEIQVEKMMTELQNRDARVIRLTVAQTTTAQTFSPETLERAASAVEALNRAGNTPQGGGDGEIPVRPLSPDELSTMFNTAPPRQEESIPTPPTGWFTSDEPILRRRNTPIQETQPDEGIWAHHRKKL